MNNLYDAVIIGGGPAGLTAALYLARAKYRVLVVEKEKFGGQITITAEVVNYPGVEKTSGKALTETMRKQAESFGAEMMLAEVTGLHPDGDIKTVLTTRGELKCFGILLATGARPRMIGFPGETEFRGRGVAYCATCDGEFFTGKEIFVVGGGFAAAEEAVFLTKYGKHVTILVRGEDFSCAKATADAARANEKITILTNTEVVSVSGDNMLKELQYKNNKTGETYSYKAEDGDTFGVFVFAGYQPETSLYQGITDLNEQGYVITDCNRMTNVEGLYAAGDVCVKSLRQVVTAVGDGALAATELEKYAAKMQKRTGLHPEAPQMEKQPEMKKKDGNANVKVKNGSGLFDEAMLAQLNTVFSKMESNLILKLYLDETEVSKELKGYMEELADLTDKLTVVLDEDDSEAERPCVRICDGSGTWTGLSFHGVPGGHEFTSFILGLYNAAGPGQTLDDIDKNKIKEINKKVRMQVLVSLSCTMCPDLVAAAQRIASLNSNVTAEVYDLNHFKALRDKYNVMSVPCLIINDGEKVSFGKKNISEIMAILE